MREIGSATPPFDSGETAGVSPGASKAASAKQGVLQTWRRLYGSLQTDQRPTSFATDFAVGVVEGLGKLWLLSAFIRIWFGIRIELWPLPPLDVSRISVEEALRMSAGFLLAGLVIRVFTRVKPPER